MSRTTTSNESAAVEQDAAAHGDAARGGPADAEQRDRATRTVEQLQAMAEVGFDKPIGLRYLEATGERVRVEWDVVPELHQPYGIVHGGVYCTVVETVCSIGGALWFGERGNVVGVNNNTNFLRAVRAGRLEAVAEPRHQGRLQQLWQVRITDDDSRLIAEGQVRLQNVEDAARLGG